MSPTSDPREELLPREPHPTDERCLDCATEEELTAALFDRVTVKVLHTNPAPPCPFTGGVTGE